MLVCHPDTPAVAIESMDVEVNRSAAGLALKYIVRGEVRNITLPPETASARRDGLWKSTCFEAFLCDPEKAGYHEFNLSPSTEWAAYAFDDYREGARNLSVEAMPTIAVTMHEGLLEVAVTIPLEPDRAELVAGITAVIEETDGTKSYWALRHPTGKPDFHHPDCFALTLPAPHAA